MAMEIYLYSYTAFLLLLSVAMIAAAVRRPKVKEYPMRKNFNPRVLVMMPCKGHDIDLAGNIRAAMGQDFKGYDFITIVEDGKDPALMDIRKAGARHMLSGNYRCMGSKKVRSLAAAMSRFRNYDVYVILDSDTRVDSKWLGRLVAPLGYKGVGLSTSFQVFNPVGGFWSKVKHAWGFIGQGLLESERTRFGVGSSLAFRKDLMSREDFRYFSSSISDDIALTSIAKGRGLGIAYVSSANPYSDCNDNFPQFAEWSTRQTALLTAADRRLLYFGIASYSAIILLQISSVALAVLVNPLFLLFLIPSIAGALRLYTRSGRVSSLLIYFILNPIYLANLVAASRMRTIKWRGSVYGLNEITQGVKRHGAGGSGKV